MRCPSLTRLPYRAVSGLPRSVVRLQSQNFLTRRCASTAVLRSPTAAPAYQSILNKHLQQRRNASGTAAAVLEAAASDNLSQEAIIENLDPVEAGRLSRVRNIGIAVRQFENIRQPQRILTCFCYRRTSTAARLHVPNVSFSIPAVSRQFTRFVEVTRLVLRWTPWTWSVKRVLLSSPLPHSVTG